jgi:hypothetical protein
MRSYSISTEKYRSSILLAEIIYASTPQKHPFVFLSLFSSLEPSHFHAFTHLIAQHRLSHGIIQRLKKKIVELQAAKIS